MFKSVVKLLAIFVFFLSTFAWADPAIYLDDNGVALSGNDPVAYFTAKSPVKGKNQYTATYQDAVYLFSNNENRAAFVVNPSKYAPQYGGYCAYAISFGKKAPGEPSQWTIVDGKLYINYNDKIKKQWLADAANFIKKANSKWDDIKND